MNDFGNDLQELLNQHPFLSSMYHGRPVIRRWGPSLLHIDGGVQHVGWAMLVERGYDEKHKTLVWGDRIGEAYGKSIASIQTDSKGVFVGRHPMGVPFVIIEDWTHVDDVTGLM